MTSDINNPRDVTSQPGPFLAGALPAAPPDPLPIVAIRTAGLSFESLVGVQTGIKRTCIVSEEYLDTLVHVANARFLENQKRIDRFREAFRQRVTITSTDGEGGRTHDLAHDGADASRRGLEPGSEWEDVHLRRERKRAEGLRRQDEVNRAKQLDQENNARRIEGQQKHGEEGGRLEESGEESGDAEADVAAMMGSFGIQ
jgi:tRNA wybutosine-synthesizing protein 3